MRYIIDLIVMAVVAYVARAILSTLMKGFGNAAAGAFQQQANPPQSARETPRAGELHKDPVCGTYVSEASSFRRQVSGKTIYYCSDACLRKHVA